MAQWRAMHHLVEFMPWYKLVRYLHLEISSSLALIDAIVCSPNGTEMTVGKDGPFEMNYPLLDALILADDVRKLPNECTMRDGRKWRSIPFVIFHGLMHPDLVKWALSNSHARLFLGRRNPYAALLMLHHIQIVVKKHHEVLLRDYENFGMLVRFEHGRAQIRQALRRKPNRTDTEYYRAKGDRRRRGDWVTFSRDREGLSSDVALFEELLSRKATETDMHKFFEEHPAVLMEARGGIPLSHDINFTDPRNQRPDFSFTPILGPLSARIELMELKGPDEKLVTRGFHPGFTRKVHAAIDQVRDYDEAMWNPANFEGIRRRLGFLPESSHLAVLIGRNPEGEAGRQTFESRKDQVDVEIVTYDEIFERQACQL